MQGRRKRVRKGESVVMSAVRLSFLQVITVRSSQPTATLDIQGQQCPIDKRLHRDTHMTQSGRRMNVHMLTVIEQTHRMFTQTPTTYSMSIHTFTHVIQTQTPICPHTHCLVDVRTPFLLSSQSHWRRHAYTHKRSNKT